VKYAYCASCDEVSVLSNLEPERCHRCQKKAVPLRVRRPWQHWVASGVILAGAVIVFVTDLPSIALRFGLLLPFIVFGLFFSAWGLRESKQKALKAGRARAVEEG